MFCRGKCSLLTLFCGKGVLVALGLGECGPPACFLGLSVPRGSLIGNGLCSRGSRLSTLLLPQRRDCLETGVQGIKACSNAIKAGINVIKAGINVSMLVIKAGIYPTYRSQDPVQISGAWGRLRPFEL
jgi:hypothetical protein